MKSANPWEICIPYVVHFFPGKVRVVGTGKKNEYKKRDADAVIISVLDMPVLLS